ncbi:hypothetical protein PIN31009_05268 [Pandoraea iniqua]|uniref:energy transducer TonB n=1 Tax=Pandoraea iniqua TaxID=2508288 RepID=UPI0012401F0F|nr:energy transducer TonB [Pandoraea iniqua]VVE58266.1 hypothetical protein PIN31009_05268 [Pandoraea iniqua]
MSGANGAMPLLQVPALPSWLVAPRASQALRLVGVIALHVVALVLALQWHSEPTVITPPAPIYATLVQDTPAPAVTQSQSQPQPQPQKPQPKPQVTPKATPRPVAPSPKSEPAPSTPATDPTPAAPATAAPSAAAAPAATPSPVVPATPHTITHGVQYLRAPVLTYPESSRRMGEEGVVTVRVLVGADGLPREITVRQSSGSAALDAAGIRAVQHAVFKPYTEDGKPQAVYVIVPLRFSLDT